VNKNAWSNKVNNGRVVILGSLIKTTAFWQGKTKCSDWLPANRTVHGQTSSNFWFFQMKLYGLSSKGMIKQYNSINDQS
jgi:hypothetical protein